MDFIDYIPLVLAFLATIAGIFSDPGGSRIGVWAAVCVGLVAFGVLIASSMSLKNALDKEADLRSSLVRIQAQSDERKTQLSAAQAALARVEQELATANSQIRGLDARNAQLTERLQDAQEDLTSMKAPELRVLRPSIPANCTQCEGLLELVNSGGTVSSVNDFNVIALGRMRLNSPAERDGCLFKATPLFGGDPDNFERRFDLRFGLRYAHQGEEDVATGETVASVDLGKFVQRLNALLIDVSAAHLEEQTGLPDHRADARSLRACMNVSAFLSMRIVYSAANGAQSTRTYTYRLSRDDFDWRLVPLSGDIPMIRFGQVPQDETHDGLAAQLERLSLRSREQVFRALVEFVAERRIRN